MPDLRKDPLVERWVIIAPERGARPQEYVDSAKVDRRGLCPFCAGNESETPAEIDAIRDVGTLPDGPGWRTRAVPNKFPFNEVHEVLVDAPAHVTRASQLSIEQTADVLRLYRSRLTSLRNDPRLRYVQIFKNVGEAAGASMEHLHSQLTGLTFVPPAVNEELAAAAAFYKQHGHCAFCHVLDDELTDGRRIVESSPGFVVLCPYASRFPCEMHILPHAHAASFDGLDDAALADLAAVMRRSLVRLESVVGMPAYNLVLHIEPFDRSATKHYHWHWEILPRTVKAAGFEWGTGVMVNPIAPEEAADCLRRLPAEEPKSP